MWGVERFEFDLGSARDWIAAERHALSGVAVEWVPVVKEESFRCAAEVKKFRPEELPTLYGTNRDAFFYRSAQQAKEIADDHWAGLIGSLTGPASAAPYAHLYFNLDNPLVRRLVALKDGPLLRRSVEMLYVQALLLGHHPLTSAEMRLMNEGLLGLIDSALDTGAAKGAAGDAGRDLGAGDK